MSIVKFFNKKAPNTQVYDLLADVQQRFIRGDYGAATKCLIIIENPDGESPVVKYDTCGVHLANAVGLLEIAKKLMMKDV